MKMTEFVQAYDDAISKKKKKDDFIYDYLCKPHGNHKTKNESKDTKRLTRGN